MPRNAFLQPEALVEFLDDHREEVRMRVAERRREAGALRYDDTNAIDEHARHLKATFDPATCTSCTLFSFCRQELRDSNDPAALLVEIGVAPPDRSHVIGLIDGTGVVGTPSASIRAQILATVNGAAESTGQRRVDQAGQPGTINVAIAKSDSAALGVYGIAVQRVTDAGAGEWKTTVFDDPQGSATPPGHYADPRR